MNDEEQAALTALAEDCRRLSGELAVATDDLNDAFGLAEEALQSLRFGVEAHIPLGNSQLAYAKVGRAWGLFMVNDDGQYTPIASAPRGFRKAAAYRLVDLTQELRVQAQKQLAAVQKAISQVDAFIADAESGKFSS